MWLLLVVVWIVLEVYVVDVVDVVVEMHHVPEIAMMIEAAHYQLVRCIYWRCCCCLRH